MYSDPALIRKHKVKLSFNDNESALLDAICQFTGQEKAALLRDLLLDRAMEVLHGDQSAAASPAMRGAQPSSFQA